MKKIVLMPVKNEAWILKFTLSRLSLWADHIIIADQQSVDGSRDIYTQFPKVVVIDNPSSYHSSSVRKLLLDAARNFNGNNILFSFDADEIPTGHILEDSFWADIATLYPGTGIELPWLNLWRSSRQYRVGDSVFAPQWKPFGFVDDRRMDYESVGIINDHTSRIPRAAHISVRQFELPKVLHYQFANWDRTVSKQIYYRMSEWVHRERGFLLAVKINLKYFPGKDEHNLQLEPLPVEWLKPYGEEDMDETVFKQNTPSWYEKDIEDYFAQYGLRFFSSLDIWHAVRFNRSLVDPRTFLQRLMQRGLYPLYCLYSAYNRIRT